MSHSESLAKLAPALVKAQAELPHAKFDSTGHFKDKQGRSKGYASLSSYMNAARPVLTSNGLAISQMGSQSASGETYDLTTMLLHESGEFISGTSSFPIKDKDPQKIGSLDSYARRYGYAAILGMVSSNDDDGQAASASAPRRSEMKSAPSMDVQVDRDGNWTSRKGRGPETGPSEEQSADEEMSGDLLRHYTDAIGEVKDMEDWEMVCRAIGNDKNKINKGDLDKLRALKDKKKADLENDIPF